MLMSKSSYKKLLRQQTTLAPKHRNKIKGKDDHHKKIANLGKHKKQPKELLKFTVKTLTMHTDNLSYFSI